MIFAALLALLQDRDAIVHDFVYRAQEDLTSVFLAGTFNNWSNGATPLARDADGRTWHVHLPLTPGKHLYKFVLNGKDWIVDPSAQKNEDDGNGHTNSVLLISPKGYDKVAKLDDGSITASALRHDTEPPYFNHDRGRLQLCLRVRPDDIRRTTLVVGGIEQDMGFRSRDEFYETRQAAVEWDRKKDLTYVFKLKDGPKTSYFGPKGLTDTAKGNVFLLSAATFKPFRTPEWIAGTVIYQIFPDRFENGDRSNDPKDVVKWDTVPTGDTRFGGDIAGIEKRMSYLKDLGVGAIYFNPIFESPVIHRYETTDYKKIDPGFGTNAEFSSLTKDLESNGIRTIVDGVFNHTATNFFAFSDVIAKQQDSSYKDWYYVRKYPVKVEDNPNYVGWWGFKSMPKLNVLTPGVRDYLLSVPEYWAKHARIHGWRLDAANEVDSRFWQEFRAKVKAIDPGTWIVGEVWGDGTPWLKGDQWDSIMGYQFRDAAIQFVAEGKMKPSVFMNRLMQVYDSYAPQVSRNLMNLLSSHDTARFITLCKGDARLAKLAATLQLTWAGTPSIYYGEELGMEGDHDPGCRAGMEWSKANDANPMLDHYRKLIAARNQSPALQSGMPMPMMNDDQQNILAYSRTEGDDVAFVVVNRAEAPRTIGLGIREEGHWVDILTGKKYTSTLDNMNISLGPVSAAVLVPASRHFVSHKKINRSNHEKS